jgi:DNA-binding transcriptional MerR regulator
MGDPCWRIDELARKADLTVDTIRYYSREGLLQAPVKQGRNRLYGQEHLDRLDRIRDLRDQRFSLAAIRAIVDVDRPGLEGLFGSSGREYTLTEITERAELDDQLVQGLREVGLLPDPAEFGGDSYDDTDLGVLRAVAELQSIGMTPEILLAIGRIYVDHFSALQQDVLDMLSGKANPAWDADELVKIQTQLTSNAPRLMPAMNQVLNYVHQRTLQRLTLEAARTSPTASAHAPTSDEVDTPDARGVAPGDA